jgi:hypothetical protein
MNDAFEPENRSQAMNRRDQALRRVGHMRRWVIGSSAALTAGFAVFVAEVAHGRSSSPTPRSSSATTRPAATSEPALPAVASAGDLGLRSPDHAPQPATSAPQPSTSAPQPSTSAPQSAGPAVSGGS